VATISEQIQQVYMGLLGRPADQEGLNYWKTEIESGLITLEQFRANIVNEQPEYAAGQGAMGREQVIIALYDNLFNRPPEAEGLEYWLNGGGAGVNADQLVLALVNGASAADQVMLEDRVATTALGFDAQGRIQLIMTEDRSLDKVLASAGVALADVSGVLLHHETTLTLSAAQAETLFSSGGLSVKGEELGANAAVAINVDQDLQLSDLVDGLPRSIDLRATVSHDATLTLTAQELHERFTDQGIDVAEGQQGSIQLTGAGSDFDPFFSIPISIPVDHCGRPVAYFSDGGSIASDIAPEQVSVVRSPSGYERPEAPVSYVRLLIDSDYESEAGVESFCSSHSFLRIVGDNDLVLDKVTLGAPFIIDFSSLQGELSGLTIKQFQSIWESPTNSGVIYGNHTGTRINVELGGDLGVASTGAGLHTWGVPTYMVTSLFDAQGGSDLSHQFVIDDKSTDLETLGLQANPEGTIDFLNVPDGVNFLLEGDGLQTFSGGYDSVGLLSVSYRELVEAASVTLTSLAPSLGFAPRTLKAAGIEIDNAASLQVDVVGGDALIESLSGDSIHNLTLSAAGNVTLAGGLLNLPELQNLDASSVVGDFTLELADCHNDLSAVSLVDVDHIALPHGASLTLNETQLQALDTDSLSVLANEFGQQQASLTLVISSDTNLSELLDLEALGQSVKLTLTLVGDAELTLSAAQLDQFVVMDGISVGSGSLVITGAGPDFDPYSVAFPGEGGSLAADFDSAGLTLLPVPEGYERPIYSLPNYQFSGDGVFTFEASEIIAAFDHFALTEGAQVTLNVLDLGEQLLDLDALAARGFNIGVVAIDGAGAELHPDTTLGGADEVRVKAAYGDVTLELSAEQFSGIATGLITEDDTDCDHRVSVMIDQLETLELGLPSTPESDPWLGLDLSSVGVSGSSTLVLGNHAAGQYSTVVGGNGELTFANRSDLGDFAVALVDYGDTFGEQVTFTSAAQAERTIDVYGDDNRAWENTRVAWAFGMLEWAGQEGDIDLSSYARGLGEVSVNQLFMASLGDEPLGNVLADLHGDIPFVVWSGGFIPFDTDLNITVEPFGSVPELVLGGATYSPIEAIRLVLGGEVQVGNIYLDGLEQLSGHPPTPHLVIESHLDGGDPQPLADNPNRVGDISATADQGIDLYRVALEADQAQLALGSIYFTAADATGAELSVDNQWLVSIEALVADQSAAEGADQLLSLSKSGAADLVITGTAESAAIAGFERLQLELGESTGDITLGGHGADGVLAQGISGDSMSLVSIAGTGEQTLDLGLVDGLNPSQFVLNNSGAHTSLRATVTGEMDGAAFELSVSAYQSALQVFTETPSAEGELALLAAYEALVAGALNPNDFALNDIGGQVSANATAIAANIAANYAWSFDLQAGDQITFTADTTFTGGRLNLGGGDLIIDGEVDMSALAALDGVANVMLTEGSRLLLPESFSESQPEWLQDSMLILLASLGEGLPLSAEPLGSQLGAFDVSADTLLLPDLVNTGLRGSGALYELADLTAGDALGVNTGLLINAGDNAADLQAATQAAALVQADESIHANDAFYYLTDNGQDSALFLFDDTNANGAVDEGEVSHIVSLLGVADASQMSADNFLDFV